MSANPLHTFDVRLCEYVLNQLRGHLICLSSRPTNRSLTFCEWDSLDVVNWIADAVSLLPNKLADHIWAGQGEGYRPRPLTDAELVSIHSVLHQTPMRLYRKAVWEPCILTHARSVECVLFLRSQLTVKTAEEWAEVSGGFAARLFHPRPKLALGVALVHEWLWEVRRLQAVVAGPTAGEGVATQSSPVPPASNHPVCGWKEAMAVTGLKKTKLYDLFAGGVLPGYKDGGMIRFYRTGLTGYMKERENAAPSATPAPKRKPVARTPATGTRFKFL